MEKKVLDNFLKNRYSKDEYLEIIKHFKDDKDFEMLKKYIEAHWETIEDGVLSDKKRIQIHANLQEQIHNSKLQQDQKITRRIYRLINKVAAILIIPLLIVALYFFHQWKLATNVENTYAEIHCPLGTRTKFNLPDGTTGWLNSGSSLKYPVQFNQNRKVELKGEAYIDVVRNTKSPFIVNTTHFVVKVLGTKFNVRSYLENPTFEVTLESGVVQIFEKNSPRKLTLKPNYQFSFNKELWEASLYKVDPHCYTSWKDGKLMFRNTPLSDVLKQLGRWYNVSFECIDESLLNIPYRATFQEERLEHVLELLTLTAPINYEIIKPVISKDGTYAKQKVIISRKK